MDPSRIFRVGGRGLWHLEAHQEYGVRFSLCGIRVLAKETQAPDRPLPQSEICGRCLRHP